MPQVDYECLPEEVQEHFQDCGTVNRVTILTDIHGHPKGYAYVEFLEVEAVQNALQLNDTELHDRRLKVQNEPFLKFALTIVLNFLTFTCVLFFYV